MHNPENPERPTVEVKNGGRGPQGTRSPWVRPRASSSSPINAPINVAERLGYRCKNCGTYSSPKERTCPKCAEAQGRDRAQPGQPVRGPDDRALRADERRRRARRSAGKDRVTTTRKRFGKEEVVVFERCGEMIRVLDQNALEKRRELEKAIAAARSWSRWTAIPFVLATGSSETELLGDVRHDPYGGHAAAGHPTVRAGGSRGHP